MQFDFEELLNAALSSGFEFPDVQVDKIPEIPLYMDQVTSLMNELLSSTRRHDTDKLLTKTMINNYAKNKLLPAPEKKKYNRQHMLLLTMIYCYKGFLSLQDIQTLLKPLNEQYFGTDKACNVESIYEMISTKGVPDIETLKEQIEDYCHIAENAFTDEETPEEDQDFLRFFTLISCLSMDVYLKKQLIERLIDQYRLADN